MRRQAETRTGEQGPPPCSPVLDAAAELVLCGVNVIALEGKRPRGPWKRWQSERQADLAYPEDDAYLLEQFERGGNVGAVTGAVSGVVVFDADSRPAWDALATACGGTLPRTVVSKTAKGRHLWFAHPGTPVGNRARIAGVKLDVRGDGGYVVVPPSIHPSGRPYTWHRSPAEFWPPAALPSTLLELLSPRSEPDPPTYRRPPTSDRLLSDRLLSDRYARAALTRELAAVRGAVTGSRNDRLNRAAFSLARFLQTGELRGADVAGELIAAAIAVGLPESEARRTIASAFRAKGAA